MSTITTHVLDTSRGRPASGVRVVLEAVEDGRSRELGQGETDSDGRLKTLLPAGHALSAGVYRLTFHTAEYFGQLAIESFYPSIAILFEIREPTQHHHVPLLLSPYGYSTYRGS